MDNPSDVSFRKLVLRISLRLFLIICVLLFALLFLPSLLRLFLPFILAFIMASVLAPVVSKFTKQMGKIRKFWSMLFVILLILAMTGILIYAGYYLFHELSEIIGSWESIRDSLTETLNRLSDFIGNRGRLTTSQLEEYISDLAQDIIGWMTEKVSSWAPNLVSGVSNIASGIASFVVSLLFFIVGAYFMTADYPGLRRRISDNIPNMIRPHMQHVKTAMGSAMFGYLRAQLILSGTVSLIIFIALLIYGQRYSLIIALAAGIIDLIPFFGSGVVLIPWAAISLLWGTYSKALFLILLSLGLFLFRKLAEPKVVGNQTGLSPLVSLISIYVGMRIGGVVGMILVPIFCMIVVGLYRLDFFTPTINDFKLLFHRIIEVASIPDVPSINTNDSEHSE